MKERGILFSAPMVRALLAGTKTQTRRIMKPQPCSDELDVGLYNPTRIDRHGEEYPGPEIFGAWNEDEGFPCPYGRPGSLLWVRETWRRIGDKPDSECAGPGDVMYASTADETDLAIFKWRPSIFMPRWASRITLRITDVRVERLQEISERDAIAEGIHWSPIKGSYNCAGEWRNHSIPIYRDLWKSINGAESWEANPWVWVVTFERIPSTSSEGQS